MRRSLERIYASTPDWLQTLAVSAYGWKIRRERFGSEYRRWQQVFADHERRSPAELAAMQDDSIRALVAHAFEKVPYYRDVMRERKLGPDDICGNCRSSRKPSSTSRPNASSPPTGGPVISGRRTPPARPVLR